ASTRRWGIVQLAVNEAQAPAPAVIVVRQPSEEDNDRVVQTAYGAAALSIETIWQRFARAEVDALLAHLHIAPPAHVIDVGAGAGRHGIELAARGFRVHAFDFAEGCIQRAEREKEARRDDMEAAEGSFQIEHGDARSPRPQETSQLVLCLYDVVGSSPSRED